MITDTNKRPLFIFCGGKSRRLGRDKALLTVNGKTFLSHLAGRSAGRFSPVSLLSNGRPYDLNLTSYRDVCSDYGPLGGLLTAMRVTNVPVFATVTVDAPLISDRLLDVLSTFELPDSKDAAVLETPDSLYPLTGLFRSRLREKLNRQLLNQNNRVMDFIGNLNVCSIPCSANEIANINTEADYKRTMDREP